MVLFHLPIATVGTIPTSIISPNRLSIGTLSIGSLENVLVPAISIALLGMVESLLCGASAGRMTNRSLDSNQELIAQGIGNMILPFFGGIPATAAIARTSVAIKAGGQTRLTGIIHALVLFLSMMVLAPIMSMIPMPALAGVLIITAWRMNEWHTIQTFVTKKYWVSLAMFFVTMASTVIFDLSIAIVIGVISGMIIFLVRSSAIKIALEPVDWLRMNLPAATHLSRWTVVYISGPLFFMSAEKLKQALQQLDEHEGVIFSLRGVPHIDITALAVFEEFQEQANLRGQKIMYTSLQPDVAHYMQHLWQETESEVYPTVAHGLATLYPAG
jgi:SulP family sulfate permease